MDTKDYSFYQQKNADICIFQSYISTKLQGSKSRSYEICCCYVTDYTFVQFK